MGNFWDDWGYHRRRKRKYNRFWTSSKKNDASYEAKNYGMDYVIQKYGADRINQISKDLERDTRSPGRSGSSREPRNGGTVRYVRGRGYVKVGSSKFNAPPKIKPKNYAPDKNVIAGGRFRDGGPSDLPPPVPPVTPPGFPPGTFKPRLKLNLENDEELAQGSQHEWAQPTSISSTITGLLRQAQNASSNYWDQWAMDKGGQYALDTRGSSSFGVDLRWTPENAASLASSQPMGAFGTNTVMDRYGQPVSPHAHSLPRSYIPGMLGAEEPPTGEPPTIPDDPGGPDGDPPPPYGPPDGPIVPPDINPEHPDPIYNPWGSGEGAENNAYGPNPQFMADATLQALSLANAYFAPQRMELAYELGDMETDMRRLAVNLGRQVDDPVLQAKLYKEAMRSVRTLDVQQNTFAFQMAEQRRREELQNFQFYDQLGQEEYKLRLQNRQFYENLELARRYYDLQNWNVRNPPTVPTSGTPPTVNPPAQPPTVQPMIQRQWPSAQQAYKAPSTTSGIYGNLLGTNPYAQSMGGGDVTRRSWGL